MERASAPTFHLSSDSAGEPPHGFVGGVVFTSTPHLKGKGHRVSFNLQQGTKKGISTCLHVQYVQFMSVQTNLFYLDQVFGPSCPQDTATAVS